jgi:hypothetical protein
MRRGLRLHPRLAGWRHLPRGQAIDLVVHDDIGQVDVAAHRLNEVVQADTVAVAVTARGYHCDRGVGQPGASGKRQRAAVQAVCTPYERKKPGRFDEQPMSEIQQEQPSRCPDFQG